MVNEKNEMIRAEGICKYYGEFAAIEDVTFSIPKGQIVAFLGPNGAGKTTTMKILTGFLTPSKGKAFIAGKNVADDPVAAANRIGYLPETGPLYPDMTPMATLRFFGEARGLCGARLKDRIDEVISSCGIDDVLYKPVSKISHGYRQRVGLAQALLHEPDILILDEPTSGLDPNQIRQVRRMIGSLAETRTILLSTHILQEVEAMSNRIILINEGRILFDGSRKDFLKNGESIENVFCAMTGSKNPSGS
ncbi:MAG: ABC transporter ATP-binding protein [Planctomycetota bacterium]